MAFIIHAQRFRYCSNRESWLLREKRVKMQSARFMIYGHIRDRIESLLTLLHAIFLFYLQSLKALQDTEESFTRGRDLISRGEFESALKSCIDTLSQLDKILCPPYRDYIQCQEGARRCLLTFGNTQIVPS